MEREAQREELALEPEPVGLVPGADLDLGTLRALEPSAAPDVPRADAPPVEEIAARLAASLAAGEEVGRRRVVFVTLQLPGQGPLSARLTKSGDRVDVRLKARSESLRGALREKEASLRGAGRARGVDFGEIRVV